MAVIGVFASCCVGLPMGCGESEVHQTSMPVEFAEKLVKEHPELFVKKVGKKIEKLEGRDKREIIREEWRKAQENGAK